MRWDGNVNEVNMMNTILESYGSASSECGDHDDIGAGGDFIVGQFFIFYI